MAKAAKARTTVRSRRKSKSASAQALSRAGRQIPAEHKALIEQIFRLRNEYLLAVDRELGFEENTQAWRRARKAADAAQDRLAALTRKVLARPVASWADIAVLAELAKAHDADTGKVTDPDTGEVFYRDLPQEVLSAVLDGVLHLAGLSSARGFVCGDAARIYRPSVLACGLSTEAELMGKATDTTRRAVLTGAATLALVAPGANGSAAQSLAVSLQPSEHGRALLNLLPAMAKAIYGEVMGIDFADDEDAEYAWGDADDLVQAILDNPEPSFIDLSIVATFNTDWDASGCIGFVAARRLTEHLLKLGGIDPVAIHTETHFNAYERSIAAKA